MRMKVSTSLAENDIVVVAVEGEIDAHTSGELDRTLSELLSQGHKRLAIDLAQVSYTSSAGLRVLLSARQKAGKLGGGVRLFGLNANVRKVFETAGFDQILHIVNTRQEAVDSW
jgi:anti-anti-sigma factor